MNRKLLITIICLLAFLLPTIFQSPVLIGVLVSYLIFVIFGSSLNIVIGYLGELSFGHAAFFGIGAYAATIWSANLFGGFWIGTIFAMILCGLLALFISQITFRSLSGIYFAIVTFGIAEILRIIVLQWIDVTRGPMGISGISRPSLFGFSLDENLIYYYFVLAVLLIVTFINNRVVHSAFGRALISIRESQDLSQSIGIDLLKYKTIAFVFSGIIAGLSGSLFSVYYGVITPHILSLEYTTIALIIVVIGGKGHQLGPFLGGLLFVVLPEFLHFDPVVNMIIFGVILLLFVIYMPYGLVDGFKKIGRMMPIDSGRRVKDRNAAG
jgi:branched-chain amino acid transport system permease protein